MSVKIYNVLGMGFVVGEKKSQDKDFIYLEYPAIFSPQMQTPDGIQDVMFEAIPQFFNGRNEMLKRFQLKKALVLFSGKPNDHVLKNYGLYVQQLRAKISGIRVVGSDAMSKLPTDKDGKPIIKH